MSLFRGQSDISILFVLMAVVIFLALMAAIGAWVRGGGLKREDAESLFADNQEKHREEVSRLEKALEEARIKAEEAQAKATEAMHSKFQDLDSQVTRTRTDMQNAVTRSASDHNEALTKQLEHVTQLMGDTEKRMGTNLTDVNASLENLQGHVSRAGSQVREALLEIARQQQDQKAQGTITMCEALITSLGTLKSSISQQLLQSQIGHEGDEDMHTVDVEDDDDDRNDGVEASNEGFAGLNNTPADDDKNEDEGAEDKSETSDPFASMFNAQESDTPAEAAESSEESTSDESEDTVVKDSVVNFGNASISSSEDVSENETDSENESDGDSEGEEKPSNW